MAVLQSTTITGSLTMNSMAAGFMKVNAQGAVTMDTNTYLTGITSGQVTGALGYTPYNSSNPNGYISQSTADGRYLIGTTNPGSVGNFTLSIGNNGSYSYVQSHSGQPLELNPVGNAVRIAGNVVWHQGNLTNLNQLTNGPGYIVPNSSVSGWISFSSSTQGTPIIRAVQQDTTSGFYLFQGVTGSTEVFRVDRSGTITSASDSIQLSNGSFRWRHAGDWVYAGNSSGDYGGSMGVAAQKYWSQGDYYFGTRGVWLSAYLNQAVLTTSAPTFSGITLNGSIVNNNDGAVIIESNASENNNWLWKENAKQWGLFWFNRGSQSGQTIGSYTTIGAELMFMGGSSGIAMPTGWTGYIAGSNIAAMISNWNGYIYSASTVFAASDMRAPIFYDSQDTAYYVDPNSTSKLVQVNLGTTNTRLIADVATGYLKLYGSASNYLGIGPYNNNGWIYFENISNSNGIYFNSPGRYAFDTVDVTPYTDAENSLGNPSYRWSQVYTSGWLRQYGAQGMYNQDYGTHFYSSGGGSWNVTGSGGNVELVFRSNHQSTIRGYVYADTGNSIGFLNNSGGWSLRMTSGGDAYVSGYLYVNGAGTSSSIFMQDTDEGQREIHCNSNRIGFLTQGGSWGAYLDDSNNWFADGSMRAPIFYDSNDTTYYGDFNGTSRFYQAIVFGDSSRYSGVSTTINGTGAGDKLILYGNTSNYDARVLVGTDYDFIFKSQGSPSNKGMFRFYSGNNASLALEIRADQNIYAPATIYSAAYRGNANVGGTGEATYHPAGIYSTGTNWLYGTMYMNNNSIRDVQEVYNNGWFRTVGHQGLHNPTNDAHFYPNNASYGSWRIDGTRNGWHGLHFNSGSTLMMNSNETGVHREGYGWQWRWADGTLYCHKNSFGGGTSATVLDSSNYSSWAQPASTAITTSNIGNQSVNYASTSGGLNTTFLGNGSSNIDSGYSRVIRNENGSGGNPTYAPVLHLAASDTMWQIAAGHAGQTNLVWRSGYAGTWYTWHNILHTGNFTSYINAPNSVGNGNGYYNVQNWLQVNGAHGIFWPSYYSFHIRPNISSSHTQMEIIGSKNSYGGIYDNHSAVNGFMYDGGGNGGVYRESSSGRWYWYYHVGNACMGINTSTTSSSYAAYVNGNLYATGDITAYSDRRKKIDIITIDNALDKVTKLRGVYYNKIDDLEKGRQTGVIAQEINEVLPEVVTYAADIDEYGVKYGNIVGVLIEAIKEQQLQIEKLQNKLDNVLSSR